MSKVPRTPGSASPPDRSATALVVAHPGHELRLFRWLEVERPTVFVLTDGSGAGRSRILSSYDLHRRAGCVSGSIMGRFADVQIYRAIVSGDAVTVANATVELADALVTGGVNAVVSDAFEFYNPAHDLCAVMARLAATRAEAVTGRRIERFDYAVTEATSGAGVALELDDATVARKLQAAYAFENLTYDVNVLLEHVGIADVRRELVRPLADDDLLPMPASKPLYETHGEQRVAAGRYAQVLRYEQHFVPFVRNLVALVSGSEAPAAVATRARVS